MTDAFLDRPGARIAYDLAGPDDAPHTLLALHGLTSSRAYQDRVGVYDWSPIAHAGERIARIDARGHGASTGEPDPEVYRWPALAEDLLALADAVSPDAPVDGLGESMGCGTLVTAAVRRPERFRKLVLVIPPTGWETRAAQAGMYAAAADLVEQRGLDAWIRAVSVYPPTPILAAGGWRLDPEPSVSEALLPSVLRGSAASDFPDDAAVAALEHETLILPWTTDLGHPVSTAERLAELLPNATLEIADTPDKIRGWGPRVAEFLAS